MHPRTTDTKYIVAMVWSSFLLADLFQTAIPVECDSLGLRPMPACIGDISEVAHRVAFESDSD